MQQNNIELKKQFPSSRRVWMSGEACDVQVPFRSIALSPTITEQGTTPNDSVVVYDTAGPYHDDEYEVNVQKGIPQIRAKWIEIHNFMKDVKSCHWIMVLKKLTIKSL